jgi:hypothetical protein
VRRIGSTTERETDRWRRGYIGVSAIQQRGKQTGGDGDTVRRIGSTTEMLTDRWRRGYSEAYR